MRVSPVLVFSFHQSLVSYVQEVKWPSAAIQSNSSSKFLCTFLASCERHRCLRVRHAKRIHICAPRMLPYSLTEAVSTEPLSTPKTTPYRSPPFCSGAKNHSYVRAQTIGTWNARLRHFRSQTPLASSLRATCGARPPQLSFTCYASCG